MAEALFHAEFGYYTRHIRTVGGSRGDFATSPALSSLLGKSIAAWIRGEIDALGLRSPVHIIEIGPGEGRLLRDVIESLEERRNTWRHLLSRGEFRFHAVEISPRLRERQRETLRAHRRGVTWHERMETALAAASGEAIVFSNELVDAFPARLLRRYAGDWAEIFLAFNAREGLNELLAPPRVLDRQRFAVLRRAAGWPEGQRVEIHDSYRLWWKNWSPRLRSGALLTIDYGAGADDLYRRRPEGTLRAYFRHQRLTGPGVYRLFGRQDLTADVCFDDLADWGAEMGLKSTLQTSQADFLRQFAPEACVAGSSRDRAAAFLLDPDGAGGAFRVLGQRKEC